MRSSVVYSGMVILISASFSFNLACGESPTDEGEQTSDRRLALSLLSGMKARWDNEGSFVCKLEIAESDLARGT